jgi:hypothetical protein
MEGKMIIFSIAVPADLPGPLLDWLRHSIASICAYLGGLGFKQTIANERVLEGEDENEQA